MLTIAVCGNHQVVFCTESELAWTLEDMGHTVLRFQENKTTTDTMLQRCIQEGVQLFLYIHTHGWTTPGQMDMLQLIALLRGEGIKTASFHLDLYWGLNKGDKRQDRIGEHPFWHTDVVFTADGGHQIEFKARGVNHHWLPPAVAKRHCFRGTFRKEYATDIAFVGSRGYHPEYPFRRDLIDWLGVIYGPRFRRFNGDTAGGTIREAQLNDVYASAKVVVGDSCFGGIPYYWSDRVPETLGRGGFLIHPAVEGLNISGLVTIQPHDLVELKLKIDHYLEQPGERRALTDMAMREVAEHHTYHNRMQTMLEVL